MDVKKKKQLGWIFLIVFAILIVSGIVAKRMYGLPDTMVFFHFPAAFFLVISFNLLSYEFRQKQTALRNKYK